MPRIETTIKAEYLSSGRGAWSTYSGIRELLQNARDAEIQLDAPMTVEFVYRVRKGEKVGAMVVKNDGCVMPRETILTGHSTKLGDSRLIGKYGEGFCLGLLALLRNDVDIKIRNGSEVWNPVIARSDKFDADVLAFDITTGHKYENRVQIEVVGISEEQWVDIEKKILFLNKHSITDTVDVSDGKIIIDPRYKGMVFVKGMFVHNTDFRFGYDFKDADIDRDRRMLSNLNEKTSSLLAQACNSGKLSSAILDMLMESKNEVDEMTSWRLRESGMDSILKEFEEMYGGALPVRDEEEVREFGIYGVKAMVAPYNIRNIWESRKGTISSQLKKLRQSAITAFSLDELSEVERNNFNKAVKLVAQARQSIGDKELDINNIFVCHFSKGDLLGTYNPEDGTVRLAKGILNDFGKTLYTLIHEVAHEHGRDGYLSHEKVIGELTEVVFNEMSKGNN
jgi:hypothetical protein